MTSSTLALALDTVRAADAIRDYIAQGLLVVPPGTEPNLAACVQRAVEIYDEDLAALGESVADHDGTDHLDDDDDDDC